MKARDSAIFRELKPQRASIHKDEAHNGLWRIMYDGKRLRPGHSSWTARGMGDSMRYALQIAWDAEYRFNGRRVPADIQRDIDAIPE